MLTIMPDSRGCGALSIFPGSSHVKEARGTTGRRIFVSDKLVYFIPLPDVGSLALAVLTGKVIRATGSACRGGQTESKEAFPTISHDVETWIAYVPGGACAE